MVIANLSDGETHRFDLSDGSQYRTLQHLLRAGTVSALALHHHGVQHVLPLPQRFRRRPTLGAERLLDRGGVQVGERVFAQAGTVRLTLTATYRSKLIRCDLVHTGAMKYNPS